MIFYNIKFYIQNPKTKTSLFEKIDIFINLIKKFCAHQKIIFNNIQINQALVINELKKLGLLDSEDDLMLIKKTLQASIYYDFFISLTFYNLEKKNIPIEINSHLKKSHFPKLIDLFCGAGGFSLGFVQENYSIELANDIDTYAIETYKYNHPSIPDQNVICGDLKNLIDNLESYITSDIDIIIGGPPCQSFSSANQQRIVNDPRNILYKYFIDTVNIVKPKFILMENVRGMLKVAPQVVEDFAKINYHVVFKLYNAADFSVPQNRIRIIYIGVNNEYMRIHNITPEQIIKDIDIELLNSPKFVLSDALFGLRPLECAPEKNMSTVDCEISGKKIDINYNYTQNDYINLINNNAANFYVFNHKARYANSNDQMIYSLLKQGENSTSNSIEHIMPYKHRNHIFKDKYYKLFEHSPSKTITAHLKMDGHSHIHPTQARSLTPREAARLQSFPDNYLFLGPFLKTYSQIGNAVPPLMSKTFAKIFKRYIIS